MKRYGKALADLKRALRLRLRDRPSKGDPLLPCAQPGLQRS